MKKNFRPLHAFRIYNPLTLEEYKYDEDMNGLFWGENKYRAEYVVDQVGELSLFYSENFDDSEWITPNLIAEILIKLDDNYDDVEELRDHVFFCIKYDELIYKPEIFNGMGYKSSVTYAGDYISHQELKEIDIYIADEKARKYYSTNQDYKWLSTLESKDIEIVKNIMLQSFKEMK